MMNKMTIQGAVVAAAFATASVAGADAPRYFLMIDPAKLVPAPGGPNIAAKNMVQDFGLSYAIVPELELTVGQFKAPTTAEGLDSSGDLSLPERPLVGRTFGDKREMGIRATGHPGHVNNKASL